MIPCIVRGAMPLTQARVSVRPVPPLETLRLGVAPNGEGGRTSRKFGTRGDDPQRRVLKILTRQRLTFIPFPFGLDNDPECHRKSVVETTSLF